MKRVLPSFTVLAMLLASGCASVHSTMIGAPRPAISVEQVRVFQVPPKRYEEIARLDASSAIGFGTQGQANAAINRLRQEAAKYGADGVLLLRGRLHELVGIRVHRCRRQRGTDEQRLETSFHRVPQLN